MLPQMTMKHYSRFVVDYLVGLMGAHKNRISKLVAKKDQLRRSLYPNQFFQCFDAIYIAAPASALSKEHQNALMKQYPTIKVSETNSGPTETFRYFRVSE